MLSHAYPSGASLTKAGIVAFSSQAHSSFCARPERQQERALSMSREGLACLDVGTADAIEILPLDTNELDRRLAFGGMNRADVIKARVPGMHQIGPERF